MNANDIDTIVRLVGSGLQQRRPEREIVASLVSAGVSSDVAPKLFADVKVAIRRGVQSVVIGADDPPSDPLLLAAYWHGRAAVRGADRSVRSKWILLFALLIGAIALAAWLVVRGG